MEVNLSLRIWNVLSALGVHSKILWTTKTGKWGGDSAEFTDKPSVEIGETQETLELSPGPGNRPVGDC